MRRASRAYVGLGSNHDRAMERLHDALDAIAALHGVFPVAFSPVYDTEPQDYGAQPWFKNQVAEFCVSAEWRAESLLSAFLDIERALGRLRSPEPAIRFGPRIIDIDLLLFDGPSPSSADCIVPHPRLCRRAFALIPLLDIAPNILIHGIPAKQWLGRLAYRKIGHKIFQ